MLLLDNFVNLIISYNHPLKLSTNKSNSRLQKYKDAHNSPL